MIFINNYLPTGCVPLDELLNGGIEPGVVTQVFGEAGSGKTNLCLQLAVNCVRKGFLKSEEKFNELTKKLDSMSEIESLSYLYDVMIEMNISIYDDSGSSNSSEFLEDHVINSANENGKENAKIVEKGEVTGNEAVLKDSVDQINDNISERVSKLLDKINIKIQSEYVPKVIFIDTEGISPERFKQIAGDETEAIAKNIIIYEPHNLDEQYSSILEIEKLTDLNIGLVIIDSATSFYRYELDDETAGIQGRRELANQIGFLHTISRKNRFPVLITSQVFSDVGGTNTLKPLGGRALEHISKTILFFEKTGAYGERTATIIKHRSIPEGKACRFKIVATGLE